MNKFFISCIALACLLPVSLALSSQGPEQSARAVAVGPAASGQAAPINPGFLQKFAARHPSFLRRVFRYKPDLLSLILYNSVAALTLAYEANDRFVEQAKDAKTDDLIEADLDRGIQEYKKLVHQCEVECPILLLGECTKVDFWPCSLSRLSNPRYRQLYEDRVVTVLCAKIDQAHGVPVQYVSFGSGGLFQDLVILTKVLAQKPDAVLAIHFIDIKFTPYVAACDVRDGPRIIGVEHELDLKAVMSKLKEIARREWRGGEISDHQLGRNIGIECICIEAKIKEVVSWLTSKFPHAQLTFYVHNSGESYVNYLTQKGIAYPDVLTAVDIQDEMSLLRSSVLGYYQLCRHTLLNNPLTYNLWLDKTMVNDPAFGWGTGKDVELVRISLDPCDRATEVKLKKDDGSEEHIYRTAEKL